MVTVLRACLIGTLLEGIIWGVYFAVFLWTLRIFFRKLVSGFVSSYLAGTAVVLFILITLKLVVDIIITIELLLPEGSAGLLTSQLAKLGSGVHVSLTMIADVFVVYRVFAVWSRSLIIAAIPCLLAIAGIVSGGLAAVHASKHSFQEPQARTMLTTFYSITLTLNILCTALIATKLYISERQTRLSSSLRLRWTSVVVIESAALYSACLLVIVVCNATRADSVQLLFLLTASPIIGLTFSLIIVRVGSSKKASNTFTSINVNGNGRGSALQFARGHHAAEGDVSELDSHPNGQSSVKVSVGSMTATTIQLRSVPSALALADDVENQGRSVTSDLRE